MSLSLKHLFPKISTWWSSKRWALTWRDELPVMLAIIYCVLVDGNTLPTVWLTLRTLALFLISWTGIAALEGLFQDLQNRKQDLSGGINRPSPSLGTLLGVVGKFATLFLFAWFPWIWLPHLTAIWILLSLEFLLFIASGLSRFSLQERGLTVLTAKALSDQTIPLIISALLFASLGSGGISPLPFPLFLIILGAWSFTMRVRKIVTHQLEDLSRDMADGMKTFVMAQGWRNSFLLTARVLLPAEAILFTALLSFVGLKAPILPIGFLLISAMALKRESRGWIWGTRNPLKIPLIPQVFFWNTSVLTRFYTLWFPPLLLFPLVLRDPRYLVIALLHFLLSLLHFLVSNNRLKLLIMNNLRRISSALKQILKFRI